MALCLPQLLKLATRNHTGFLKFIANPSASPQFSLQNTSCICPPLSMATIFTSSRPLSSSVWIITEAFLHSHLIPTLLPKSHKSDHLKMQLRTKGDLREWHLKGTEPERNQGWRLSNFSNPVAEHTEANVSKS